MRRKSNYGHYQAANRAEHIKIILWATRLHAYTRGEKVNSANESDNPDSTERAAK